MSVEGVTDIAGGDVLLRERTLVSSFTVVAGGFEDRSAVSSGDSARSFCPAVE
jgi:hypothetical protein